MFLEDGVWTRENAPHLHFHCVVSYGVFDYAPAGGVIFHAAAGLIYTARFADAAFVLHAFERKTQRTSNVTSRLRKLDSGK